MFKIILLAWAMILGGLAAEAGADEVFRPKHRGSTNPDLVITEVRITDRETVIQIEYHETRRPGLVWVHPPGSKHAFFLQDRESSRKYPLVRSRGVPVYPQKAQVAKGSRLSLTLWFEPVPPSRYNLLEGVAPFEDNQSWHFTDIDLEGEWREFSDDGEEPKMISNAPAE